MKVDTKSEEEPSKLVDSPINTKLICSERASADQLEHCEEEFVLVKKSHYRKNQNRKIGEITISNRFERLVDEPVHLSNVEVFSEAAFRRDKNVYKQRGDFFSDQKPVYSMKVDTNSEAEPSKLVDSSLS